MKRPHSPSKALALPSARRTKADLQTAGASRAMVPISGKPSNERTKHDAAPASQKSSVSNSETRLFDLIRMIRDWIEHSFTPGQESRLEEKGRLRARFKVELGQEMADNLRAYVAASFALRLLKFRVTQMDDPRGKNSECVEVILTPEARNLYQEKYPDACAKHSLQLARARDAPEGGLVDADDEDAGANSRKQIEDASGDCQLVKSEGAVAKQREVTVKQKQLKTPEKSESQKKNTEVVDYLASPAKHIKLPAANGSVWESLEARIVPPGDAGLIEAKDALDRLLAARQRGGLEAFRSEKEAVSWLKGLSMCEVGARELRETKIGMAVNDWRKQKAEQYVTELAATIVMAWKQTCMDEKAKKCSKT